MTHLFAVVFFSFFASAQSVEVDVTLSPAGSFVARTSSVTGHAVLKGNAVAAQGIKVKLTDLKTGISLRDSHTKKYLETEKYPETVLIKALGKNGKGKAKIKLRGKEKMVNGSYTLSSDKKSLTASFPLILSEFDITGIKYMGVGVKDQVMVRVQIPVKQLSSTQTTKKSP